MIDAFAAVLLVGGAAIAAVGGLGLVRFPDVFTRMHAATKAATVGVIAMTAAAAAEAGAPSGVLVLLLVVALLFLSAPLGMSLLARAAYHDPQTPRWPRTRELQIQLPTPESTNVQRGRGTSSMLGVWLLLAWVGIFGSVRPHVVVGGVAVAVVLSLTLRALAPRWPRALAHPMATLRFTWRFAVDLLASTWDVASMVLRPIRRLQPAVVEVPVLVATRTEVMLLMSAVSFIPGTVALELHDDRLYLHVLSRKPSEIVVAEVVELQHLISAAVGGPARSRNINRAISDV